MKIIVDGYCKGNPGQSGYKGIDSKTHEVLFQEELGISTNNIAEYLTICHAFHYLKYRNLPLVVISDSVTAMSWIKKRKTNTSFKGVIKERLEKAENFISSIENYKLEKWDTRNNGENPADFGNKK